MENEVQLQITASAFTEVKDALASLTTQIGKTSNALKELEKTSTNLGKNASKGVKDASKEIDNMGNKASSTIKKMNGFNTMYDAFKNTASIVRGLTKKFGDMITSAVDYSEELNLFNVVFKNNLTDVKTEFSEVGLQAEKFQQQLHEAFGTNLLETRRFQALYQAMGENMGIVTDKAEIMSENLTKLTYDIASLYNASEQDVGQALKAGIYAGQTKPLRQYGIDVTQVSMQPIMDELGLDKSISELSQAEKQILRYISVMRQASVAHGDFANTLESPANQLKILKQQFVEMKIAIGNLFVGAFARMLPYVNAILMVIREVAKAIASFFGIKVQDFNAGITTSANDFEDLGESVGGVGDNADKASKAVKELKRQTLGFDQINNLTTPTPSSGSSGGGASGGGGVIGGIDQKLLDALKGYENGMEKVRMKANEIRDKILEWLGFTKEIDPLTGEVSWKYQGIGKTLKNMWKTFNDLSFGGKVAVILGLAGALGTVYLKGKKVVDILGATGLFRVISKLISPTTTLIKYLGTAGLTGRLVGLDTAFKTSINSWRANLGIIDGATGKIMGLSGAIKAIGVAVGGLTIAGLGISGFHKSLKEATLQEDSFKTTAGQVVGALATIAGGMQAGASIAGPYGALIGGLAGAFIVLGDAIAIQTDKFLKIKEELKQNKKATDELVSSIEETYKAYERGSKTKLEEVKTQEAMIHKLKQYVDENGNVRDGYEEQVKFIMGELKTAYGIEGELIDGRIKDYDNYIKKIQSSIETKRAEIYLKEYEGKLTEAIKNEAKLYDQMTANLKTLNTATGERLKYEEKIAKLEDKRDKAIEQMKKLAEAGEGTSLEYMSLEANVRKYNDSIRSTKIDLENATQAEKDARKVYKETADEYAKSKNIINTYSELSKAIVVANETGQWDEVKKIYKEGGKKTTDDFIKSITEQSKAIHKDSDLSQEMLQNWQVLSALSREKYNEALNKLPKDTRKVIDDAVKEMNGGKTTLWGQASILGEGTGKSFKTGAEKTGKTTLKVTADTSQADKDFINLKQRINGQTVSVRAKFTGSLNINGTSYSVYDDGKASYLRKNALGGVFSNGIWKNIKQYASGGIPTHGTMFTAGERGPEIVGHIGRRTEVLNQSQLASVMYEAVSNALSNTDFGGIEFVAHTDEGIVIDKINRITRQTGQCPLEI